MKRALISLVAILMATPAFAQEQPAAPEPAPFEVVRLGDSNLSCEALVGEIGTLNQQLMAVQQNLMSAGQDMSREAMAASRQRPGGGLVSGLGGLAASFIPGGGLVMGAVQMAEQQAAASSMRAQQDAMQARMAAMTESTAMLGPLSERVAHLSEIARNRSC